MKIIKVILIDGKEKKHQLKGEYKWDDTLVWFYDVYKNRQIYVWRNIIGLELEEIA